MLRISYSTQKQLSKIIKYYNEGEISSVEKCAIINNKCHINLTYKEWRSVIKGYDYGICVKFDVKDEENINKFINFYEGSWQWCIGIFEKPITEIGFSTNCEWEGIDWFIEETYRVLDFEQWKSIITR